jgi:hypothetical protein
MVCKKRARSEVFCARNCSRSTLITKSDLKRSAIDLVDLSEDTKLLRVLRTTCDKKEHHSY